MRKFSIRWFLPILLCLLLGCVTVSASESGSLRIVDVEKTVALYPVAGYDGSLTETFRNAPVTDLLEESNAVENAAILDQFEKENQISGQEQAPDETKEVYYASLETGVYLVRSSASEPEFAPFLVCIPTRINQELIYDVKAEPKAQDPTDPTEPTSPTEPMEPEPEIPQTGNSIWPQYLLLGLGVLMLAFGFSEMIRGREKQL